MVYPKRASKLVMSRETENLWVTPDFPDLCWSIVDKSPVCMVVQNVIAKTKGELRLARVYHNSSTNTYRYMLSHKNYPSFLVEGNANDTYACLQSMNVALRISRGDKYEVKFTGDKSSLRLSKSACIKRVTKSPGGAFGTYWERIKYFPQKIHRMGEFNLLATNPQDIKLGAGTITELGRIVFDNKPLIDIDQHARDILRSAVKLVAHETAIAAAAAEKAKEVFKGDIWVVAVIPHVGYVVTCVNYIMADMDVKDVPHVKPPVFVDRLADLPDDYRPALFKLKMLKAHRGSLAEDRRYHLDDDCLIPNRDSAFPDMNAASYHWAGVNMRSPMFMYLGA